VITKQGTAILNSIIIGKAYPVDRNKVFIRGYKIEDIKSEQQRLKTSISRTIIAFDHYQNLPDVNKTNFELYDAYKLMLEDELFTGQALAKIEKEKINAEYALKSVRDHLINSMLASKSDYIRERIYDLENIYQRIQRDLINKEYQSIEDATTGDIIISMDLNTSDIDIMISKKITAFATNMGGKTSHNSIVAKSAGILGIVALNDIYENVVLGDTIIIDGFLSTVIINPDNETLEKYQKKIAILEAYLTSNEKDNNKNIVTKDNVKIKLSANIESNLDIDLVKSHNLSGVGLYRTEFLFIKNPSLTEDEQYHIYKTAADKLLTEDLTLRTYDLGADKFPSHQRQVEQNPIFGLRAIRYCLKNQDFFREHLRAILKASANRENVRIMIPMITSVDELIKTKDFINSVKDELRNKSIPFNENIKVGIMIELPAVAVAVEKFINYSDFFSVGTNDLIQYTLGVDRSNSAVADYYTPLHPTITFMLANIYEKISQTGKEISICGEIATDYRYLPILLGIGYRSFSMNPRASKIMKKLISEIDITQCQLLYNEIKDLDTIEKTQARLKEFLSDHFAIFF